MTVIVIRCDTAPPAARNNHHAIHWTHHVTPTCECGSGGGGVFGMVAQPGYIPAGFVPSARFTVDEPSTRVLMGAAFVVACVWQIATRHKR